MGVLGGIGVSGNRGSLSISHNTIHTVPLESVLYSLTH